MKICVRRGVFETNSSSVHSLCICSKDDYDRWKNGELFYDYISKELTEDSNGMTYEEYLDDILGFEEYTSHYKTKSGDDIVAFGYYGYD